MTRLYGITVIALALVFGATLAPVEGRQPSPPQRICLAASRAIQSVIGVSPFYEYRHYFTLRENPCEDPGGRSFRTTIFLVDSICPPTWSCSPGNVRHGLYSLGGKASNDAVSCLLMGENLAIMVFEHDNWEGQWAVFYNGLTLPPAWNDRISSFVVFPRQFQQPLGLHVLAHYTKFLSGGYLLRKFIPMHALPRIYRLRYPYLLSSLRGKRLDRITRTSLDLAWRVCTGTNFTGQCLTVPSNPQDKRLEVWLPANIRGRINSLEMWLISEEGKYGCVDHGDGIVSCTYAQKKAAATAYQNPPQTIGWTAPRTLRMQTPAAPGRPGVRPGVPVDPKLIRRRPPVLVRRCPAGWWWDRTRQRCARLTRAPVVVNRCPPGQYWNARLRRCLCLPGHWWDSRLRRCVRRAVAPRPPMIHRCPPGQVWNVQFRRCVAMVRPRPVYRPRIQVRCPSGQHWDARARRCVCPPGQKWSQPARRCLRVVR